METPIPRRARCIARRGRGPNVWVVRRASGFTITQEGSGTALVPAIPQQQAVRIARLLARANKSELIVQSRSGRIRLRDSHGADPFPPRG